jgi:hypothetical protein
MTSVTVTGGTKCLWATKHKHSDDRDTIVDQSINQPILVHHNPSFHQTMKFTIAAFLSLAVVAAAYEVPSLTPDNYEELTADKTVL